MINASNLLHKFRANGTKTAACLKHLPAQISLGLAGSQDVPGTGVCQHGYTEMIQRFPEDRFTWLSLVGNTTPPRHPNNGDDYHDEEEDDDEEDEDREPAVIREPDEDE